jgi:uncharacterized protein
MHDNRTDEPGGEPTGRVCCDAMLGSLVSYLRMCGYDTVYALDQGIEDDDRLLALTREEGRVLLTRDRELAARARTATSGTPDSGDETGSPPDTRFDGYLIESREVTEQLRELQAAGYRLALAEHPTRCGRCNGPVTPVENGDRTPAYAPDSSEENIWRCVDCGQCFWKGSHWASVERTLEDL